MSECVCLQLHTHSLSCVGCTQHMYTVPGVKGSGTVEMGLLVQVSMAAEAASLSAAEEQT